MAIQVLLVATLRKYKTAYNPVTGFELAVQAGTTLRDLARQLNIPGDEVKLIMVNGKSAPWETALEGNERVSFFPPVGGG